MTSLDASGQMMQSQLVPYLSLNSTLKSRDHTLSQPRAVKQNDAFAIDHGDGGLVVC